MRGKQNETTQRLQIQPLSPCSVLLSPFSTSLCVIRGHSRMGERRDNDLPLLSCSVGRLTTPTRDANLGLEVWDSRKCCPKAQFVSASAFGSLDASPFHRFSQERTSQCPHSHCALESLVHRRSLPVCWRSDLCAARAVPSSAPGLLMSSSSGIHRGSAVLGTQEGGEMFWDRFIPTVHHGCCQEISSSSLSDHMGTFWGVSVGHPWTLGFAGLQFPPSCGLQ